MLSLLKKLIILGFIIAIISVLNTQLIEDPTSLAAKLRPFAKIIVIFGLAWFFIKPALTRQLSELFEIVPKTKKPAMASKTVLRSATAPKKTNTTKPADTNQV